MSASSGSAASTVLKATPEKRNFLLLTRLLIAGGTELVREVFDLINPPHTLSTVLSSSIVSAKLRRSHVTKPQYDLLYPAPGVYGKSAEFDVTLLFKLLREICGLTPPVSTGSWDKLPGATDLSQEADLARLKFYRNSVYGHPPTMEVSDGNFMRLWREIREAMLRLAKGISSAKETVWKNAIDKLLKDPLTPEDEDNVRELNKWYLNDVETKKELVKMQSVTKDTNEQVTEVKRAVARSENKTDAILKDVGITHHEMTEIKSTVSRTEDKTGDILRDVGVTRSEVTEIKSTVERTEDKTGDIQRDVGLTRSEVTEIKSTVERTEDKTEVTEIKSTVERTEEKTDEIQRDVGATVAKADDILRDVGVTRSEVTEIKSTVERTEEKTDKIQRDVGATIAKADDILKSSEMARFAIKESSEEIRSSLHYIDQKLNEVTLSMKHSDDEREMHLQAVGNREGNQVPGASAASFGGKTDVIL